MRAPAKFLAGAMLVAVALLGVPLAQAQSQDPSLHQVYQAVHEGRFTDAQSMMNVVLRDHPDSAKAHYVDAEVLVRLDRVADAQAELAKAQSLAPGLPFAKPEAVSQLRSLIAEHARAHTAVAERPTGIVADARPAESSFPWGVVLIVLGAGIVLFLFLRARQTAVVPVAGPGGAMMGPGGVPYGGMPYGGMPMGGGGIGSSIVGGLATGAAVGAGMVAGEALAHEFMGNHDRDRTATGGNSDSWVASDDAGGRDFGVSGSDSWDSGGSGGDIAGGDSGGGGGDWG